VTWFESENMMSASNLAVVISPSLIWQRMHPTGPSTPGSIASCEGSHTSSFINDAHQQTKVVELLIQHAYEVFTVDRRVDWSNFFEQYPDVEEPKPMDRSQSGEPAMKMDANTLDESDEEGEEGDLVDDEDFGLIDEDMQQANTTNTTNNDDSGLGSGTQSSQSMASQPPMENAEMLLTRRLSASLPKSSQPTSKPPNGPTASPRRTLAATGKQRSFTTSILVSPQSDRKFASILTCAPITEQNRHESAEAGGLGRDRDRGAGNRQTARSCQRAESSDSLVVMGGERTLCSGEVIIDIKKEQYCLPSSSPEKRQPVRANLSSASFSSPTTTPVESDLQSAATGQIRRKRLERSNNAEDAGGVSPATVRSTTFTSTGGSSTRFQQQPMGVLFAGSDVSYV